MNSIYKELDAIDDKESLNEKYNVRTLKDVKKLQEADAARTYRISRDLVLEKERAIGLRIKRIDGVLLPTVIYFPKSQCTIVKNFDSSYTVTIPLWLLKKKLPHGEQIFVG